MPSDPKEFKPFLETILDLEQYAGCEAMSPVQWANNLIYRKFVVGFVLDRKAEFSQPDKPEEFRPDRVLARLLVCPLGNSKQSKVVTQERDYSAVFDVELYDVISKAEWVLQDDTVPPAWERWNRDLEIVGIHPELPKEITESLLEFEIRRSRLHKSACPPTATWAYVNLDVTEEKAIDDFRKWWRKKQATLDCCHTTKSKKHFTDADFRRWANLQVLAYIDLGFILKYFRATLTDDAVGNFLYPDDHDVTPSERIRKTTRPLAAYLMNSRTIAALAAHAMYAKHKGKP